MKRNRCITNGSVNKLNVEDRAAHDWYRFVLSFPPHLVRDYIRRFSVGSDQQVLDPFCGTGTTLVECKKLGIPSVGIEANPMAYFASKVKVDWNPDPDGLTEHANKIAEAARVELESQGIEDHPALFNMRQIPRDRLRTLSTETQKLLLTDSISPLPLHKTLVLLSHLKQHSDERYTNHEMLALANSLVFSISNLYFGPEVGVGPAKSDAPVVAAWLDRVYAMAADLRQTVKARDVPSIVHHGDSRQLSKILDGWHTKIQGYAIGE